MCLHFLFYYPRVNFKSCVSVYDTSSAYSTAADDLVCENVIPSGNDISNASLLNWGDKVLRTLEVSPLTRPNTTYVACNNRVFKSHLPIPGVDYMIQSNRWDDCNNYNGTYYIGQNQDYYRCGQDPFVPSISFTALNSSGVLPSLVTSLLLLTLLVQALIACS